MTGFLVVRLDVDGRLGSPLAFVTALGQGVSYRAGIWLGALIPRMSGWVR